MNQNHTKPPEFEGYSPNDMHTILYDTFSEHSPVQLLNLSDAEYKRIPILQQIKYLLKLVEDQGELKLTAKGYLPPAVVKDIYSQGFLLESSIESGIVKLHKEADSRTIGLAKILIELSGLVKKRSNKLSLTQKGKTHLNQDTKLLPLIFITFVTKFNWAYYDGYSDEHIGQLGCGFSLVLLSKYGHQLQTSSFYANKYLKAFPNFIERAKEPNHCSIEENLAACYCLRTFDRFLNYFGLIESTSPQDIFKNSSIKKTDLYDRFIHCLPPNKGSSGALH